MNHNLRELREWGPASIDPAARPVVRFLVGLAVVAALLACAAPKSVFGQSGSAANKERRQQIVDELLRGLNKMDMTGFPDVSPVDPVAPAIASQRSVDDRTIQSIRRGLDDFANEAGQLSTGLNTDLDYIPEIRPLFGDMLEIRRIAFVLQEKAKQRYDHGVITAEFVSLDQKWRVLSYKLKQVQRLDKVCQQRVDKLDQIDRSLGELFQLKGQINYRELASRTASLAVDLQNLQDDLTLELEPSDQRTQLVLTTQQLRQQAEHIADVILDQASYETIVAEYKKFQQIWAAHVVKLRPIENRYVDRNVRRVADTNRNIHELLWLPQQVDSSQLLYLTENLKKTTDEYFTRAPLKLLIELPTPEQALPTANEFYGLCENFVDNVEAGGSRADLISAFRWIDESWRSFDRVFRPLKSSKAQVVLNQIQEAVGALRTALNIESEQFDRNAAVELAATLANLADHIDYESNKWLDKRNPNYQAEARSAAHSFIVRTRRIHENIVKGASVTQLRSECIELYEQWRVLYGYISKCDTEERPQLGRLAAKTTPALVELRTMLEL